MTGNAGRGPWIWIPQVCDWDGCRKRATHQVQGRKGERAGKYCKEHGNEVVKRLNDARSGA